MTKGIGRERERRQVKRKGNKERGALMSTRKVKEREKREWSKRRRRKIKEKRK